MNTGQRDEPSAAADRAKGLAGASGACKNAAMILNIVSLVIGAFALLLAIPAFLPLLGWANWIIVPIAIVGLALGALSGRTSGRNLNIVVIIVGILRLSLGGGIL